MPGPVDATSSTLDVAQDDNVCKNVQKPVNFRKKYLKKREQIGAWRYHRIIFDKFKV